MAIKFWHDKTFPRIILDLKIYHVWLKITIRQTEEMLSSMNKYLIPVFFLSFQVNTRNEWASLCEQFHLPSGCINSGVGLKQIYLR
jgi:hypothetical protein